MMYVTCMGAVYKMKHSQYKKLLKDAITGKEEIDPNDYGKCLTGNVIDITDLDAEEARWRLAGENAK